MARPADDRARPAIVVVGASLGGVEALVTLVRGLPPALPAAVFVALHSRDHPSLLPQILRRSGALPVSAAQDGAPIHAGHIYVAPAGHHLLLSRDHMHVVQGPRENGFRPAIDPLFRSAARTCRARVIGVILTGLLDDGTAGLLAVKRYGGVAIVQDPEEALAPQMPRSALAYVAIDHIVRLAALGPLIAALAAEKGEEIAMRTDDAPDLPVAEDGAVAIVGEDAGTPTPFSCPECTGVLSEVREGTLLRFRCQIGHRYSPLSLAVSQRDALDQALAAALTAINERGLALRRLAEDADARGDGLAARRFAAQARAAEEHRAQMRVVLDGVADVADAADAG
ncbi:MAG: chemotaxis protein CheB [Chloroflexi bacterium]|nr:chemotaxis protein CheB [Chloroflexota bacterium]